MLQIFSLSLLMSDYSHMFYVMVFKIPVYLSLPLISLKQAKVWTFVIRSEHVLAVFQSICVSLGLTAVLYFTCVIMFQAAFLV